MSQGKQNKSGTSKNRCSLIKDEIWDSITTICENYIPEFEKLGRCLVKVDGEPYTDAGGYRINMLKYANLFGYKDENAFMDSLWSADEMVGVKACREISPKKTVIRHLEFKFRTPSGNIIEMSWNVREKKSEVFDRLESLLTELKEVCGKTEKDLFSGRIAYTRDYSSSVTQLEINEQTANPEGRIPVWSERYPGTDGVGGGWEYLIDGQPAFPGKWFWYGLPFSEGYACINLEGEGRTGELGVAEQWGFMIKDWSKAWGFIDIHGKPAFSGKTFEATFSFSNGFAPIRLGDFREGFINLEGKPAFKDTFIEVKPFNKGMAAVRLKPADGLNPYSDFNFCFIDTKGKKVFNQIYTRAESFCDEGYALVRLQDNRWIFLNTNGKPAFGEKYFVKARSFWQGFAIVADEENKFYIIDNEGRRVLSPKRTFKSIYNFNEGFFDVVYEDGSRGFIDTAGKKVPPDGQTFNNVECFREGYSKVMYDIKKIGFIDHKGNKFPADGTLLSEAYTKDSLLLSQMYSFEPFNTYYPPYFHDGFVRVYWNDNYGYMDTSGILFDENMKRFKP